MSDVPGPPMQPASSTCTRCGGWLAPGAVICDLCGTPTGAAPPPVQTPGGPPPGYPTGPPPGAPGTWAQPPAGPGYVPGGYGYPGMPVGYPQKTNGSAIASLVLALGGLIVCPIVLSVLAIYLGGKAKNEIRVSWGRQTGEGLATAGVVIGWIGLAFGLLMGVLLATGMLGRVG